MATSQSLASIMEEMMTKVMEDAISTSIIFTQAPVNESGKEKVSRKILVDISKNCLHLLHRTWNLSLR